MYVMSMYSPLCIVHMCAVCMHCKLILSNVQVYDNSLVKPVNHSIFLIPCNILTTKKNHKF